MIKYTTIILINILIFNCYADQHIDDKALWKHVVTVDRLAWAERSNIKKVNKQVNDENFVRRIYLDITGKIPTYDEMLAFRKSKDVNKRQKLISALLNSPGYVSYYSNFWQDLLRNPKGDPEDHNHKEFTRYIERFLYENKSYDKIVYDMLTAKGSIQENQGIGLYVRDRATGPMDTLNASVRAFLGTRIGCAQCHNHRFDKWTQKEFYESAAHLWGTKYGSILGNTDEDILGRHNKVMVNDKRYTGNKTYYSKYLFRPSIATLGFNAKENLKYPDNYAYQNAKPNEAVKEKIVFNYGDQDVEGEDKRDVFAKWLTSKNNPMFAKIMTNRLWKRIMGVAIMEPIDDWKDNINIQNPQLFHALGEIFKELDYNFKAFLSVVFNSEAYQYAVDLKNEFNQDNYRVQGAILKRMSAAQLSDSLLTLQHGSLDGYSKLDGQYFEFEDKLNELTKNYIEAVKPLTRAHAKQYGRETEEINPELIDIMLGFHKKLSELEEYYNIDKNGFLKSSNSNLVTLAMAKKEKKNMGMMSTMAPQNGSMMHTDSKGKTVLRANYKSGDFMNVFGLSDRSSPETNVDMGATMKQILKMMNSQECKNVAKKDSFLMKEMWKKEKINERISYLYYSLYGRAPTRKDLNIAVKFFSKSDKIDRWSKYTLALLNSPEFYFIK